MTTRQPGTHDFLKAAAACIILAGWMLPLQADVKISQTSAAPPMPSWQRLYVGDFANKGKLYEISPDGTWRVYAIGVGSINGITFAPDGTLFAAAGKAIWKITPTPDGSPASKENGHVECYADDIPKIKALARDREGNFWVTQFTTRTTSEDGTETKSPGTLIKVYPDGRKELIDPEIGLPYGLCLGPDGDIYLASLGRNTIFRYPVDGGEKQEIASKIKWLRNVTFNPDGEMHALGKEGITRFAKDGERTLFTPFTKKDSKHPVGLAFDANGTLYTSDVKMTKQGSGTISVYAPDGTRSLFVEIGSSPFYITFWPTEKPAGAER